MLVTAAAVLLLPAGGGLGAGREPGRRGQRPERGGADDRRPALRRHGPAAEDAAADRGGGRHASRARTSRIRSAARRARRSSRASTRTTTACAACTRNAAAAAAAATRALEQGEYLPVWLERAGYVTAHIGKFLNGYGKDRAPGRPERLDGVVRADRPLHVPDVGLRHLRERRAAHVRKRCCVRFPRYYQTDVLANKAVDFIRRRAGDDAPFFLSVAYLAPHHESGQTQELTGKLVRPAPRHRGRYANTRAPEAAELQRGRICRTSRGSSGAGTAPSTPKREAAILKRMHERCESLLGGGRRGGGRSSRAPPTPASSTTRT